jgi:hypothetical protein
LITTAPISGQKILLERQGQVGYSIRVDEQENIYTTGVFYGTGDFNPGPGVYNLCREQ